MTIRYEQIGVSYASTRREDPRIKARVMAAIGAGRSLVNVGAGAGSYEPEDRLVVAVEPSQVMLGQRPPGSAPAVRARAGDLPFRDQCVDAALAILSLHHWDQAQERGLRELRRVARGPVVIATVDAEVSSAMWLLADYLPEVAALDRRIFPPLSQIGEWLGGESRVEVVEIARDTPDWTLMSFWAHPERVLDPRARNATSGFARMEPAVVERVVERVRSDLESGDWDARYGALRTLESYDAGLRLLINHPK